MQAFSTNVRGTTKQRTHRIQSERSCDLQEKDGRERKKYLRFPRLAEPDLQTPPGFMGSRDPPRYPCVRHDMLMLTEKDLQKHEILPFDVSKLHNKVEDET